MPALFHDIISPIDAVLVLMPHDWSEGCVFSSRFDTRITTARTGLESRASSYFLPRHTVRVSYLMTASEAEEARDYLRQIAGKRLALPLWVDDGENNVGWGGNRIFDGPFLTYDATAGTFTINDAGGAEARKASLLFCRMRGEPSVEAANGKHAILSFDVYEDAPPSLALSYNVVGGESPALPAADWSSPPVENFVSQVETESIGQGRESDVRGTEAPVRMSQELGFQVTRSEARRLLRFWAAKRGAWASFTMGVEFEPGSPENLTMRFEDDVLELEFHSQEVATTSASFIEELETVEGVPAQAQPSRTWLYRMQWEGASAVMAWTSWESPITSNSQAYTPQKIAHEKFTQTLQAKGDSVDIVCANFAGCPFRAFVLLELERKLKVTIYECDPENPDDAVEIFSGAVVEVSMKRGTLTASCDLLGGALSRKLPRFFVQRACNYTLYSDLCGVDPDDHDVIGTLDAQAGNVVDVLCGSTDAADYFAHGKALFGTGDTAERRTIMRSEPITGGQRLTLHRPLKQTGAIAVAFYPGCSGEFGAGGCAKFSNQDRFGGHPRQPSYIESVVTGFKPKTGK